MILTCERCPNNCELDEGDYGKCLGIINKKGRIQSAIGINKAYWNFEEVHNRFLGTYFKKNNFTCLVYGSYGCNLTCPSCPYRYFAHPSIDELDDIKDNLIPVQTQKIAEYAEYNLHHNCKGIFFGVSEPLINYEYVIAVSKAVKVHYGYDPQIFVLTNGCFSTNILEELIDWVDAIVISLRCWNSSIYKEIGGDLDVVRKFIEMSVTNLHTEITIELIPEFNDDLEELEDFAKWLSDIEEFTPIHINRHVQNTPDDYLTTPINKIEEVYRLFKKYFTSVYIGNVSKKDRRKITVNYKNQCL